MELVGWIGSALLGLCAVPLAIEAYKTKRADGINWTFLWMWYAGEIFTFIYVLPTALAPLIANYLLNIICITIVIYYKRRS